MRLLIEQWRTLAADYNVGFSIVDLATKYHISVNTILKYLPRLTHVRTTSEACRTYTDQQTTEICERYLAGMTAKEAGKIHNISEPSVLRFLKNHNIERRHQPDYGGDSDYFEKLDTEEKLYWFGFLLADGGLKKNKYIEINLGLKDQLHLEKLKMAIGYTKPLKVVTVNHTKRKKIYQHVQLLIGNSKMWGDLKKHGLLRLKDNDSEPLVNFTDDRLRHVLRGFFDGDGSIHGSKSLVWYICGDQQILKFFRNFMVRVGIAGTARVLPQASIYRLTYGGNRLAKRICDYLYKDSIIYLDRKYLRYSNFEKCMINEQEVINQYQNGKSIVQIAKMGLASEPTISKVLKRNNIQLRQGNGQKLNLPECEIKQLYATGLSTYQLAKRYNCSDETIRNIIGTCRSITETNLARSQEIRNKISESCKEKWRDPQYQIAVQKGMDTPEYRKALSDASKRNWQDPEYRNKIQSFPG